MFVCLKYTLVDKRPVRRKSNPFDYCKVQELNGHVQDLHCKFKSRMNAIKAVQNFVKINLRIWPNHQDIVDISSPR